MSRKSGKKTNVLADWTERDLSLMASREQLRRAYDVDGIVEQVMGLLEAGRVPVLVGENGVGKSAVVHELVIRAHEGRGLKSLHGKRVLQLAFATRVSALRDPEMLRPEMQKLVDHLLDGPGDTVLFFSDVDAAYQHSVEPQLLSLLMRYRAPVIGEAEAEQLEHLLEYHQGLREYLVPLEVPEPSVERTRGLLAEAAAEAPLNGFPEIEPGAADAAISLTHRFLARAHMPRKAVDLICQAAAVQGPGGKATTSAVINWFCRSHQVPKQLVDPSIALDVAALRSRFQERLLGQGEAVEAIVNLVATVKAGLADFRRPFGVFLFVGPTGVGKTHAAQLLAEYLFGDRDRIVRLNLADYQDERSRLRVFGDPMGQYTAHRRGVLTQKITSRPFGVLLLDELEKSTREVHDGLLQLFDEGALVNGAGETVSCRSMVIIATSNAGAELHRGHAFGLAQPVPTHALEEELERRMESVFRFEFLNRFDRIVHFRPLSRADIRTIAVRELESLSRREGLRQRELTLEFDESVVDWLTVQGYDPANGARFLRRAIERHVTGSLAEAVVREQAAKGSVIRLAVRSRRITARLVSDSEAAGTGRAEIKSGGSVVPAGLSAAGLDKLAREIEEKSGPLLAGLVKMRAERSVLLERMNDQGFWSGGAENRQPLERFRELDVMVRAGERLARPIEQMIELRARGAEFGSDRQHFARKIEAASAAVRDWEARRAEEQGGAFWVYIWGADALGVDSEWIRDIAEMYVAWAKRCHLVVNVAGVEVDGGRLLRVLLSVEGPATRMLLRCEAGGHRLKRSKSRDARARVLVIERSEHPSLVPDVVVTKVVKLGVLNLHARAACVLDLPSVGVRAKLAGPDGGLLAHGISDLARTLAEAEVSEAEVARMYGEPGGIARDPRSGRTGRLKDVLRGDLSAFVDESAETDGRV